MRITDLLNEIQYPSFLDTVERYSINHDMNSAMKLEVSFVNRLCSVFKTYSIEKIYAILDYFHNNNYDLYLDLLSRNDPNIMKSVLLLNEFSYVPITSIRNNVTEVLSKKFDELYYRGFDTQTRSKLITSFEEEYAILNKYLNNLSEEEIDRMVKESMIDFYNRIGNIDKVIFSENYVFDRKQNILNTLFLNPFIKRKLGNEKLTQIYNTLLQNEGLVSFDYNSIFCNYFGFDNVKNIRGMFRKCNGEFFRKLVDGEFLGEYRNKNKWIGEFLSEVVITNANDEMGLALFFAQLNRYLSNSTKRYLKRFDYYNKYSSADIEAIYSEAINRLIRGEPIDPMIRDTIGLCDLFLDKYNYFKDKFCKSNDINVQNNLAVPLLVGLAEKERRRFGFDYFICLTANIINNQRLGCYTKSNNTLYINPYAVYAAPNKKKAFAGLSQTIYHEIKHVRQVEIMSIDDSLNYDYFLMAMDEAISRIVPNYYTHEYTRLAMEQDADKSGLNDAMKFFEDYPEMQQYVVEERQQQINNIKKSLSATFLRESPYDIDLGKLYGIIELFLRAFNDYLMRNEFKKGIKTVEGIFVDIPILRRFYMINYAQKRVEPKTQKYFDKLLKKYEKEKNEIQRKDAIYAIKMFKFIANVQWHLRYKEDYEIRAKYQKDMEVFDDYQGMPRR